MCSFFWTILGAIISDHHSLIYATASVSKHRRWTRALWQWQGEGGCIMTDIVVHLTWSSCRRNMAAKHCSKAFCECTSQNALPPSPAFPVGTFSSPASHSPVRWKQGQAARAGGAWCVCNWHQMISPLFMSLPAYSLKEYSTVLPLFRRKKQFLQLFINEHDSYQLFFPQVGVFLYSYMSKYA